MPILFLSWSVLRNLIKVINLFNVYDYGKTTRSMTVVAHLLIGINEVK